MTNREAVYRAIIKRVLVEKPHARIADPNLMRLFEAAWDRWWTPLKPNEKEREAWKRIVSEELPTIPAPKHPKPKRPDPNIPALFGGDEVKS